MSQPIESTPLHKKKSISEFIQAFRSNRFITTFPKYQVDHIKMDTFLNGVQFM